MRLRKVKGAKEYILSSAYVIKDYKNIKFNNLNKIYALEVGCGKGDFIIELAKLNQDINYIAIEKFDSVIYRAVKKIENTNLNNLLFIQDDIKNVYQFFNNKMFSYIYLNFSDPWPKTRHIKYRLTHESFLDIYYEILKDDGIIRQKTDNKNLFEYSIISISNNNKFIITDISLDLHKTTKFNIQTEYERRFSQSGPIYFLEIQKRV